MRPQSDSRSSRVDVSRWIAPIADGADAWAAAAGLESVFAIDEPCPLTRIGLAASENGGAPAVEETPPLQHPCVVVCESSLAYLSGECSRLCQYRPPPTRARLNASAVVCGWRPSWKRGRRRSGKRATTRSQ